MKRAREMRTRNWCQSRWARLVRVSNSRPGHCLCGNRMKHSTPGGPLMTRSIFDPTGDDMIQEGDRFTGPTAQNISHVPPRAVDGKVGDDPDAQVPLKGTED